MSRSWNPYLDEWLRLAGPIYSSWSHREALIAKFAFAVPGPEALEAIVRLGPVVEMGAGTGYWARCLRERGVDVVAYDEMGEEWRHWFRPRQIRPGKHYPEVVEEDAPPDLWVEVCRGGPEVLARHGDRTLLLVWPFMDAMAADSLRAYSGNHVVFVGEGGCTADDEFFRLLSEDWTEVEHVAIPQWDGIRDAMTIYRRAPVASGARPESARRTTRPDPHSR